jgi:hypothetical protein
LWWEEGGRRQKKNLLHADPRNRIKGLKRKAEDAKIHVEDDEKEQ